MLISDFTQRILWSVRKYGLLGEKAASISYISKSSTVFGMRWNEWCEEFKKVKEKYKEIRVYSLNACRIGELMPKYLEAVNQSRLDEERGILDLFVILNIHMANRRLLNIMGRNIHLINVDNIDFWIYCIKHFPRVKLWKYWNSYARRDEENIYYPEVTAKLFKLSEIEELEAQNKFNKMNILSSYVCIANRESEYFNKMGDVEGEKWHAYRNSDNEDFSSAAEYLGKHGICTVRMGKHVKNEVDFENCIDYSALFYDELMDLYLFSKCKFYLGDAHGICSLPMMMNIPVALTNIVATFYGRQFFAYPQRDDNLYIIKKYYLRSEGRFLSIKEMAEVEKSITEYSIHHGSGSYDYKKYEEYGIDIISNTKDEVLYLAMEMNSRLEGKWIDTEEDLLLRQKYNDILEEWYTVEKINRGGVIRGNIGSVFLRSNQYLLE